MNIQSLRFTTAAVAAILSAAVLTPSALAQDQIEVLWTQLAPALEGRTVATVLVDGTVLKGRVLDVSPTDLRFEVKKTSNSGEYPKGEVSVPREQLSAFSYSERGNKWRGWGTAIGVAAGAVPAFLLCARSDGACSGGYQNSDKMAAAAVTLPIVGGAVGYLGGYAADQHRYTVTLVGEGPR